MSQPSDGSAYAHEEADESIIAGGDEVQSLRSIDDCHVGAKCIDGDRSLARLPKEES